MRLYGQLKTWQDDRGFGFIAPSNGGADLFVHISALPRDGTRPTVGERMTYELGRGKNGQPQAVNVQREALRVPDRLRARKPAPGAGRPIMVKLIALTLLVAVGAVGFSHYQKRTVASFSQPQPSISQPRLSTETATDRPAFKCDGRTHCSQMTSCTEAKFFLQNCPGTKMDGNNDGTPCEQQWCTSPFSK
jgi:cold shock CspA family protein